MSKTPIDPADIRKGDLIRWECSRTDDAKEWRQVTGYEWLPSGTYYLLDRPQPPVDLPTEPTLGWLGSHTTPALTLGEWFVEDRFMVRDGSYRLADEIINFTPATAVPTEALDELREAWSNRLPCVTLLVAALFDAIDEANA